MQFLCNYGSGRLTPPSRIQSGVRFFDFQCASHKTVSVMAVAANDKRLYEAHDRASVKAFAELERFAAHRSGKSRQPEISGNLCAAAFRHDASRSLDHALCCRKRYVGQSALAFARYLRNVPCNPFCRQGISITVNPLLSIRVAVSLSARIYP